MKRIDAVVRPDKLDAVKNRLHDLGITGLTAFDARGFGRQKGHTEMYRGTEYSLDFLPKLFITLVVDDDRLEPALAAIIEFNRFAREMPVPWTRPGRVGASRIVSPRRPGRW